MRLTDRSIASLSAPERGQKLHSDDTLPGFGVRVSQGGSKTFVLTVGADRQRMTLGRWPVVSLHAARERAKHILAERQLGIVHKPSPTFQTVKKEYLDRRDGEVRAATRQGDTYLFKNFDGLAGRKLADITPEMIEAALDEIKAPSTRHNAFLRVSGLMRYAVRRGYIEKSPVAALDAPSLETPRHRVLSSDELRKVLTTARVLRQGGDPYGTIVELLVYTGQRRQQIAMLRPAMVDFTEGTITWPPELMKTGRRHTIPLGKAVRALLETREPRSLYFPNRIGGPFCGWSYHFRTLCDDLGFRDFVLHDLRRTLATRWQEMGIEIATTEKMLSHSAVTGGLVGIYQRSSYLAQMRAAVEKWEAYLENLMSSD
ncbi:MAG: tyrosine-type recombinase/integrase [Stellaceae bacterium]